MIVFNFQSEIAADVQSLKCWAATGASHLLAIDIDWASHNYITCSVHSNFFFVIVAMCRFKSTSFITVDIQSNHLYL